MNKRGKEVPKQTFSKMLRNPLYMGVVETMRVRTKSSVIEPIVEEDLWLRVKRRLDCKKHEPSRLRKANPEYPLRGLSKTQKVAGTRVTHPEEAAEFTTPPTTARIKAGGAIPSIRP